MIDAEIKYRQLKEVHRVSQEQLTIQRDYLISESVKLRAEIEYLKKSLIISEDSNKVLKHTLGMT